MVKLFESERALAIDVKVLASRPLSYRDDKHSAIPGNHELPNHLHRDLKGHLCVMVNKVQVCYIRNSTSHQIFIHFPSVAIPD